MNLDPGVSLEERILAAARELFMTQGYVGTKTRQIATAANTSESGVFRYFDNKYALLIAVYNQAWARLNENVDAALVEMDGCSAVQKLKEIVSQYWRLYETDPQSATFILINTGNTDSLLVDHQEEATISEQNLRYLEKIELLCREAVSHGLVTGLSARALAEGLFGISEGVLLGWYLHDRGPADTYETKITFSEATALLDKLLA